MDRILDIIGADKSKVHTILQFKSKISSHRYPTILIRTSYESYINSVLSAAKRLRGFSAFKDVYINVNLAEKERIHEREIRAHRKALRENLSMDSHE